MDTKEQKTKTKQRDDDAHRSIRFSVDPKSVWMLFGAAAGVILLYWGIRHTDQLLSLLGMLFALLSPLLIGLCIAFVMNVLLNPLEQLWTRIWGSVCKKRGAKLTQKLKRPVCLLLSALIVIGALFLLIFMVFPEFKRTIGSFVEQLPAYAAQIEQWWTSVVRLAREYGIALPELSFNSDLIAGQITKLFTDNNGYLVNKTLDITTSIFSGVVDLVLAFVFSLYVLAQKEKLGRNVKQMLYAFFPERKISSLLDFASLTSQTFASFVTGQLTEALILGVLCYIGMLIFSIPYAVVISVLVGFTALIPVFGAFIGTAVGAFLILLVEPVKAFWFVLFIIVLQQLEGNLIYPRVVGKSVGLPGIWVLAAVTLGGNAFGIPGMLFGVPLCAVLYCLLKRAVAKRLDGKQPTKQGDSAEDHAAQASDETAQSSGEAGKEEPTQQAEKKKAR